MEKAFKHFDTNKDGIIDFNEMADLLTGVSLQFKNKKISKEDIDAALKDKKISKEDVKAAMKEMDDDGDGKFSYKDFKGFMEDIMDSHVHEACQDNAHLLKETDKEGGDKGGGGMFKGEKAV